jgi:hypothetical protein
MSHNVGLLLRRLVPIVLLAAITTCSTAQVTLASPSPSHAGRTAAFADNDGDGIQDDFDPDDDNDGITDDQDSQPSVPGSAPDDDPDILDPGQDTDGDGISNAHDPDDNNNGVTDESDPTSFPPPTTGGTMPPGSGNSGGSSSGQQTSSSGNSPSLIRSLPVTGAGGGDPSNGLAIMSSVACLIAVIAATGNQIRVTRRRNQVGA